MINGLIWLVKRSWRRNHLSSWRSCQETVNFKGLIHPPVPCVKVCVCLSLEWCPSWSRCPGLVVSGGRGAECFQPVRAAFLNKALFVFRAHSLEPARREQKSDLYGLPGELLLLSSDRTDCVCVCAQVRMCMSYFVLNYFSPRRLTGSLRILCTLDLSL